jgi:guanylate kinase
MKVRELRPDALFVFIAPPSVNELRRRLNKRGTETQEVIEKRIAAAITELPYMDKYDYIIVNDALEDAVSDFFAVIRSEQLKTSAQAEFIEEVIKNA